MKSALTNIISIVLAIMALSYLITGSPIPKMNSSSNVKHFNASLDFANQATEITNRRTKIGITSQNEVEEVISFLENSIEAAREVDIGALNEKYQGFGDHFQNEFIKGSVLYLDGLKNGGTVSALQGQVLLDRWGDWYHVNASQIRAQ